MGMKKILSTRRTDSYDAESLAISSQLLCINPDIYTLWNYRKEVALQEKEKRYHIHPYWSINYQLYQSFCSGQDEIDGDDKLAAFLDKEITLTEQCLLANPKSYGSWHHRYWALMLHPKPDWDKEFGLCTKYLTYDDRNCK